MNVLRDMVGGWEAVFVDKLNAGLTPEYRRNMGELLVEWLSSKAKLKAMPSLDAKRKAMEARLRKMADTLRFQSTADGIVVKASGEGEETLKMLENGTDWFAPCASVVNVVIPALREL